MNVADLAMTHCVPLRGAEHALPAERIGALLAELPGWALGADNEHIVKDFKFADFHRTIGFVNALAFVANREDHHPDLDVGYGHCRVTWSTHDVGGLSLNDFICAAKTEGLLG